MRTAKHLRNRAKKPEPQPDLAIYVSDHAIVRYLERVYGIDVGKLKEQILSEQNRTAILSLGGSGIFPSTDTERKPYLLQVRNYQITTVLKPAKKSERYAKSPCNTITGENQSD